MRPFWLLETQIASTAACRPQVVGAEGGGVDSVDLEGTCCAELKQKACLICALHLTPIYTWI